MKNANETCVAITGSTSCPNCWGTQVWENNYRYRPITPANNPKAFIQKFVDKYVS